MALISKLLKPAGLLAKSEGGKRVFSNIGRAALQYVGYQAGASVLEQYAENHPEFNSTARFFLGAAQMAMRYKSFQGAAASLTKGTVAGDRISKFGFRGATGLTGKAVGGIAREAVKTPLWRAPKSAWEWGKVGKAMLTGKESWIGLTASMKHPWAFPMTAGFGLGAYAGLSQGEPVVPGGPRLVGRLEPDSTLPINVENFGMGISFGRTPVTSPEVMSGQGAVTRRMLKRRGSR